MVKGVNRQIIEINNTGDRYFEKVLLFVAPGRSGVSERELHKRAEEYVLGLSEKKLPEQSLRKRCDKKQKRKKLFLALCGAVAVGVITVIVLNIL